MEAESLTMRISCMMTEAGVDIMSSASRIARLAQRKRRAADVSHHRRQSSRRSIPGGSITSTSISSGIKVRQIENSDSIGQRPAGDCSKTQNKKTLRLFTTLHIDLSGRSCTFYLLHCIFNGHLVINHFVSHAIDLIYIIDFTGLSPICHRNT